MEGWALAYEVTARKWRPQEFDGVIGQEHVTTTLKNAIQAGQIAHAYLFAGPAAWARRPRPVSWPRP